MLTQPAAASDQGGSIVWARSSGVPPYGSAIGSVAPLPADFAERPLLDLLRAAAARDPAAIAIVGGSERLSYCELIDRICRVARTIAAVVPEGSAVATVLRDTPFHVAVVLGSLAAHRVTIILDGAQPPERSQAILRDAAPALTVVDDHEPADATVPDGFAHIRASDLLRGEPASDWTPRSHFAPDEPASVHFTSGSTGRPKGIAISLFATLLRTRDGIEGLGLGPADRLLGVASMSGNNGLARHLSVLCAGARLVLHSVARDGLHGLLDCMMRQQVTLLIPGPAVLRSLLPLPETPAAFAHLRHLRLGMAALLQADIDAVRTVLPRACVVDHTYASTEAGMVARWMIPPTYRSSDPRLPSGYPVADLEYAMLDEQGNPTEPETGGELVLRSRCIARGEWRDGRCVPGRMLPDPEHPDWRIFHTGDLMRRCNDGLWRFIGRRDQQIKINGVRIEPAEIEAVLRREPGVTDAVVMARPRGAELALVAYVAAPGSLRRKLLERLASELPSAMRPARLVMLEQLPRLPGGKVSLPALPEPAETPYHAPDEPHQALLCRVFAEVTGADRVGIDDDFFAIGGDSLAAMQLVAHVQEACGETITMHAIYAWPTPRELSQRLGGQDGYTPLLPLQHGRAHPPLYCVHPITGWPLAYRTLAMALGAGWPVWGLQARGLEDNEQPHVSIVDMADAYVEAIRRTQPHGPYRLLGWSTGGIIAHAMAGMLEDRGEHVSLLALLDTPATNDAVIAADAPELHGAVAARAAERLRAAAVARGLLPADAPPAWGARVMLQISLSPGRMRDHRPARCRAPIVLFRAMAEPAFDDDASAFEWERLTSGGVERVAIACRHADMCDPGPAAAIAAWLRRRLA